MIIESSFQEMLFLTLIGKKIMYEGSLEEIKDLQFEPKTRQLIIETLSGKIFTAFKDDVFEFEHSKERPRYKTNRKRLKGKKDK